MSTDPTQAPAPQAPAEPHPQRPQEEVTDQMLYAACAAYDEDFKLYGHAGSAMHQALRAGLARVTAERDLYKRSRESWGEECARLRDDRDAALRERDEWRTKALDVEKHPAVVALLRERDEARAVAETRGELLDAAGDAIGMARSDAGIRCYTTDNLRRHGERIRRTEQEAKAAQATAERLRMVLASMRREFSAHDLLRGGVAVIDGALAAAGLEPLSSSAEAPRQHQEGTTDEREAFALAQIIADVRADTWPTGIPASVIADAILAAGFRRPTTQQPQDGDNDKGKA